MLHTVVIDDIFGISQLLMEQVYRSDLKRYRSLFIYRGMRNADFDIVTSLQRVCKHKKQVLEPVILSNFTKYAVLENPSIETSVWRQMILGQHHGLPTRLLDWSFSPLTSLHFALSEPNLDDLDKHDSVVWRIDQRIINQYSFFSIVPMGIDNIQSFLSERTERTVRYIIKKEVRWQVRDLLDQLNTSERIIYPGLDGLSQWLARHYYVK